MSCDAPACISRLLPPSSFPSHFHCNCRVRVKIPSEEGGEKKASLALPFFSNAHKFIGQCRTSVLPSSPHGLSLGDKEWPHNGRIVGRLNERGGGGVYIREQKGPLCILDGGKRDTHFLHKEKKLCKWKIRPLSVFAAAAGGLHLSGHTWETEKESPTNSG